MVANALFYRRIPFFALSGDRGLTGNNKGETYGTKKTRTEKRTRSQPTASESKAKGTGKRTPQRQDPVKIARDLFII